MRISDWSSDVCSSDLLIHSQEELDSAIARQVAEHVSRDTLLITEFCDTQDDRGLYRKYSAFNVGGRIIPRHLHFSRSWQVKRCDLIDDRTLALEMTYMRDNPHRHQLAKIFHEAGTIGRASCRERVCQYV